MKILFTADYHIKLGQKNVPVEWTLNRYKILNQQLKDLQSKADVFVVGGDIFDRLPTMAELESYFDFLTYCKIPTIIYPGNHEAVKKDTTFLTNLKDVTNRLNPLVRIVDAPETLFGGLVDILPYTHIKTFNPDDFSGDILLTHVRGDIPPHVKAEIPLEKLSRWKVVLAGDLHSYENSQANILYPGSPATTSFHRSLVTTGCIIFDCDTLSHAFHELDVPQLLRKSVKVGDPTPATDYHHTVYDLEGTLDELAAVEDNELVDKKVTKRTTDAALILDPKLSLAEEVKEYLTFILEMKEEAIDDVLKEFAGYATRIED
jgi:DNA repair exonuclease SbcCD nuclease subunit